MSQLGRFLGYYKFGLLILLRVVLLFITLVVLAAIFGNGRLIFVQIIVFSVTAAQVFELIRYANSANKELARLILSIKNGDYSAKFSANRLHGSFEDLNTSFTELMEAFRQVKIDREAQFQFFQMVVTHIEIGIIAMNSDKEIILMNNPARRLLQIPELKYWRLVQKHVPEFVAYMDDMKEESGELLDVNISGGIKNLTVRKSTILIDDKEYILISFQDIRAEIEQKEVEAWYKLIRILTHEIMNSMTPMISMTDTMLMLVEDDKGELKSRSELSDDIIEDMQYSLKTIRGRGKGLLHFVDDYRKLTKIPKPRLQPHSIGDLVGNIEKLMQSELKKNGIKLVTDVHESSFEIIIDPALIEQVLINLLTNSMQALNGRSDALVTIRTLQREGTVDIIIIDNGPGIELDKQDQVFIPFFSTKPEGSGIGLSLCRNIMHLHKGMISLHSEPGSGTTFTLSF